MTAAEAKALAATTRQERPNRILALLRDRIVLSASRGAGGFVITHALAGDIASTEEVAAAFAQLRADGFRVDDRNGSISWE